MKLFVIALFAAVLVLGAQSEKARFDNYRVYEILIKNDQQFELMQSIEAYPDGYNFWNFPGEVGRKAELVVPPHKFGEFSELTEKFQLKARMMISNLQEVMDNEQPKKQRKAALDWTAYYNYADMGTWMDETVAQYPGSVTHFNYGTSYENRALRGIKINIGGGSGKKQIVFEGLMHAREWISGATVTWMANELLTSNDAEIQELARSYEWIVIPITNPDGYEYTWTRDRSWRKTRQPSNLICFGADPNRNWDSHHAEGGASTNPCSDTYAGPSPFSEPETKALSDYLKTLNNMAFYYAFHAYGQMLMTPYGWTKNLPPNYQTMLAVGQKGVDALTALYGTRYSLGTIANVIYIASGSSADWVHEKLGVQLSYAYEFRDEGRYGFSLPADQIIPNAREIFASVIAMLKEAKARGLA